MAKANSKKSPINWPLWTGVAIITILVVAFFTGNRSLVDLYRLRQEISRLQEEKSALEKRNAELLDEIERLQNDPNFIEQKARIEYNLKRPEEDVYKVVPE
ncbi:MAG TPA: septum formation initiator family protein [Calditrichia bacterium]|nr:septum formation initiator family protein [Calditrichota bacterium]HQU74010.1 septum formation initiator family protein [Calditrichia bacterium]HQV33607.1 septum formation initiator family protein [Calditrichia bacterium]